MASSLKQFPLHDFSGGYNSYPASKSGVKDKELPAIPSIVKNVILDDNGSPTKRKGSKNWSAQLSAGHAVTGMENFSTTSFDVVIAACNTSWWNCLAGTATALTGKTFVADQQTYFTQGAGAFFGANGTDNLCYTLDGTTISEITSNGLVGSWPVYYNARIYMLSAAFPDRVYFTNSYGFTNVTDGINSSTTVITGFDYANMFNTDLSATPKKNAGFITFDPGAGVKIVRLFKDGNTLYAYTEKHGIWTITPGAVNTSGTLIHNYGPVVTGTGTPAGRSVEKVAQNDSYYFGWDDMYSRGEVQYYPSPRVTVQTGRIHSEMSSVVPSGRKNFATKYFKGNVYASYQTGPSYNDTLEVQNKILNVWSTPWTGINASCFVERTDSDGTRRLLAGSSNPANSYIVELEVGSDDNGTPVAACFETKSTDLGHAGQVKRLGFIRVFYALLYGTINYEVFADEVSSITGSVQFGSSATTTAGFGTRPFGTFPMGLENTAGQGSSTATTAINGTLTIPCNYTAGNRFSVRFSNSNLGEQFKINGLTFFYLPGSIYEAVS